MQKLVTNNMTVKEFMKLSHEEQLKVLSQIGFKSLSTSKEPLRRGIAGKSF